MHIAHAEPNVIASHILEMEHALAVLGEHNFIELAFLIETQLNIAKLLNQWKRSTRCLHTTASPYQCF